jgi:hypothetical protein
MKKEDMVYKPNGALFCPKEEPNFLICRKMNRIEDDVK